MSFFAHSSLLYLLPSIPIRKVGTVVVCDWGSVQRQTYVSRSSTVRSPVSAMDHNNIVHSPFYRVDNIVIHIPAGTVSASHHSEWYRRRPGRESIRPPPPSLHNYWRDDKWNTSSGLRSGSCQRQLK